MLRKIARLGAIVLLVAAGLLVDIGHSQPAHAASSCWAGPKVRQPIGNIVPTRYCPTWTGTYVYWYPSVAFGGPVPPITSAIGFSGYLYAGTNWMVCQFIGNDNPRFGTSYHNHYWLLTQGDWGHNGSDAWGYIPATAVSYGGNEQPIPGVPSCKHGGWY